MSTPAKGAGSPRRLALTDLVSISRDLSVQAAPSIVRQTQVATLRVANYCCRTIKRRYRSTSSTERSSYLASSRRWRARSSGALGSSETQAFTTLKVRSFRQIQVGTSATSMRVLVCAGHGARESELRLPDNSIMHGIAVIA